MVVLLPAAVVVEVLDVVDVGSVGRIAVMTIEGAFVTIGVV